MREIKYVSHHLLTKRRTNMLKYVQAENRNWNPWNNSLSALPFELRGRYSSCLFFFKSTCWLVCNCSIRSNGLHEHTILKHNMPQQWPIGSVSESGKRQILGSSPIVSLGLIVRNYPRFLLNLGFPCVITG